MVDNAAKACKGNALGQRRWTSIRRARAKASARGAGPRSIRRRQTMNRSLVIATFIGILLAAGLAYWQGVGEIGAAVASVGWGVLAIIALRVVQVVGAGVAWQVLLPAGERVSAAMCVVLRLIREAVNTLLPVAQVGGDLIGARLLAMQGVAGGLAGASVLVDLLIQTATQLVFSLVGLGLLIALGGSLALVAGVSSGLGLMALGVVAFLFAQRWGGFHLVERGLLKLAENPAWKGLASVASLQERIERLHDDVPRVVAAFVIHLVMWFVGALEILVALTCMGIETDLQQALVIESLGHAVRAAGFLIPGALGVQEGGFIALCAFFAIPAPTAIALSLVKRVPELVLGLPGLFAWHVIEARGGKRRGQSADPPLAKI